MKKPYLFVYSFVAKPVFNIKSHNDLITPFYFSNIWT